MPRPSSVPLDHRDRMSLLAQMAATGTPSSVLSGPQPARNMLAGPPPPPGSGATAAPIVNQLAPAGIASGPAPVAQQAPVAAMPSATAPGAATAAPAGLPADPDQHLAALGQRLSAANLTPDQVDKHAATYGVAVHHLGALVQKGAAVTHDDVVRQALYAVQDGSIAPDVAARFIESVKGPPQQLQAKLKQAVANTMLTNVALASLQQKIFGAAPPGGQPQPSQAGANSP